jgi:hypothetical protein
MSCPYFKNCAQSDDSKFCNIEYKECLFYLDFEKYAQRNVEVEKENSLLVRTIEKSLEVMN